MALLFDADPDWHLRSEFKFFFHIIFLFVVRAVDEIGEQCVPLYHIRPLQDSGGELFAVAVPLAVNFLV